MWYPHGFLDVVLPHHLSWAVHVPLQTPNQLSAGLKSQVWISSLGCKVKLNMFHERNKARVLVCQSSGKVVLYVGVHDRSEVVETAVPEQVDNKHLNTNTHTDINRCFHAHRQNKSYGRCAPLVLLPVTGKPAARIYLCCHLKDRKAYPGHLAETVRRKKRNHI